MKLMEQDLAEQAGTSIERVRAFAELGVLAPADDGTFSPTSSGGRLRSTAAAR